jgi:hypothetical protein
MPAPPPSPEQTPMWSLTLLAADVAPDAILQSCSNAIAFCNKNYFLNYFSF